VVAAAAERLRDLVRLGGSDAPRELVTSTGIALVRWLMKARYAIPPLELFGPPTQVVSGPGPRSRCGECGATVRTFRRRSRIEHLASRVEGYCERCGLVFNVEEASAHLGSSLGHDNDHLLVPTTLATADVQAIVSVRSPVANIRRTWELFPATARTTEIGEAMSGVTQAVLVAVDRLELIYLRRFFCAPLRAVHRPAPRS
jgi:hypothetical protein